MAFGAIASPIASGLKNALGGLPFGVGYAAGTRIGYEQIFPAFFPTSSNNNTRKYYGAPSNFKLPYYRQNNYGSRYSRYGRRSMRRYGRRYSRFSRYSSKPRFFRSYRTRRFY